MGTPSSLLANGTLNNKKGSCVVATCPGSKLLLFSPETADVIVCDAGTPALDLRQEAAKLNKRLKTLHDARQQLGEVLKEANTDAISTKIDVAQTARKALMDEMEEVVGKERTDKLVEWLPITSSEGKTILGGDGFIYARASQIEADNKGKYRHHSLKKGEKHAKSIKDFIAWQDGRGWQLDDAKFQAALDQAVTELKTQGDLLDGSAMTAWAPSFVQGFNQNMHFGTPEDKRSPNTVTAFSGNAKLLRFFAGTSLHGENHLSSEDFTCLLKGDGKFGVSYKAQGQLKADLANGEVAADVYLPSKEGLNLAFGDCNLGYFRLDVSGALDAYCGASVMATGGVELMLASDKSQQGMRGIVVKQTAKGLTAPSLEVDADVGANAEAQAFIGAEAGASIAGAFLWQKVKSEDFAEFASIEPKVTVQAGAGGAACFSISYDSGKFVILAKLGGCLGVGLKGKVQASIGVEHIAEFAKWFFYQVANAGVENLGYFTRQDYFIAFNQMCALALLKGEVLTAELGKDIDKLKHSLNEWQLTKLNGFDLFSSDDIDLSEVTPEIAGIVLDRLLAQFHRFEIELDKLSNGVENAWDELVDWVKYEATEYMIGKVKEAINKVFDCCYLVADVDNTLQHATIDGTKLDNNAQQRIKRRVEQVAGVDFVALYARLKAEPTPGYPLVPNTSPTYLVNFGTYPTWERNNKRLA